MTEAPKGYLKKGNALLAIFFGQKGDGKKGKKGTVLIIPFCLPVK